MNQSRNTFRNWHTSYGRSTKKDLSSLFPISVNGTSERICITITDEFGKRLVIQLSKETSDNFLTSISKLK
jgi:hypothetical protein